MARAPAGAIVGSLAGWRGLVGPGAPAARAARRRSVPPSPGRCRVHRAVPPGCGPARGEFVQGLVVQDHVGGHALFARLFGAPGAQASNRLASPRPAAPARGLCRLASVLASRPSSCRGWRRSFNAVSPFSTGLRGVGQLERAVGLGVGVQQAGGEQLAEDAAPAGLVEIGADAEGGQGVVAELRRLFRWPCRAGCRSGGRRRSAGRCAARPTWPSARRPCRPTVPADRGRCRSCRTARVVFAEVGEQHACAGRRRSRSRRAGRRACCARRASVPRRRGRFVDALAVDDDVVEAIGHPGFGGLAVAAGAAGFLVVGFEALGQVEVGDEAHVGLVDAHAEGDGGDHDDAVLAQEALLVARRVSASRPAW